MKKYNLVVLGGSGVGKSALIRQFMGDTIFGYDPEPTDLRHKKCVVDNEMVSLEIYDSVGQVHDGYRATQEDCMLNADGVLLLYSITSRESFEQVPKIHRTIRRRKGRDGVPVMLVANKCDREANRTVQTSEGKGLADQLQCDFIEVSASTARKVEKAFFDLVKNIRASKQMSDEIRGHHSANKTESHTTKCFSSCVIL